MSPRAVAGPEIQRILALVPWIVAHPGSPKHEIVDVAPVGAVGLFAAHDLHVESMGRSATEDPVLFEAAAAAGVLAARAVL